MNAPVTPPSEQDPAPAAAQQSGAGQSAAERSAELAELLGHVIHCWDEDRRLLARKMHDTLGSSMTALTMHLALLTQQLPQEKALQDRAAQMKTLLLNIITSNRDMQLTLWNDKLEFLGVKAAISELVQQFGSEHGVKARVSLPDEDAQCSREQGVALLRCVEEGLNNVVQHSGATEVDVILDDNDEELMLTVRDNGNSPTDFSGGKPGCHGLRLMRERFNFLGGSLTIRAAEPHGTLLCGTLPKSAPALA